MRRAQKTPCSEVWRPEQKGKHDVWYVCIFHSANISIFTHTDTVFLELTSLEQKFMMVTGTAKQTAVSILWSCIWGRVESDYGMVIMEKYFKNLSKAAWIIEKEKKNKKKIKATGSLVQ